MTIAKTPTPLLTKANLAIEVATLLLGDRGTMQDIEDLAFGLMFVPIEELQKMLRRFSGIALHRSDAQKGSVTA